MHGLAGLAAPAPWLAWRCVRWGHTNKQPTPHPASMEAEFSPGMLGGSSGGSDGGSTGLVDEAVPLWSLITGLLRPHDAAQLVPFVGGALVLLLSCVAAACTCFCARRARRKLEASSSSSKSSQVDGFSDLPRDSLSASGSTASSTAGSSSGTTTPAVVVPTASACCGCAATRAGGAGGLQVVLAVSPYSARIHSGRVSPPQSALGRSAFETSARPRSPGNASPANGRKLFGRMRSKDAMISRFLPRGDSDSGTSPRSPRGLEREVLVYNSSDDDDGDDVTGTKRRLSPRELRSIGLANERRTSSSSHRRGGQDRTSTERIPWVEAERRLSGGYI